MRVWHIAAGSCAQTFRDHNGKVKTVAFSPDGNIIASLPLSLSVELEDRICLRHAATYELLYKLDTDLFEHYTPHAISFSPDSSTLAIVTGGTIYLWHIPTGKVTHEYPADSTLITTAVFSPDGSTLATGSYEGKILLRNTTGTSKLLGRQRRTQTLDFSPDGTTLVAGSFDGTLNVWNIETGECQRLANKKRINKAVFSPNGSIIASGSDKIIRLWRSDFVAEMQTIEDPKERQFLLTATLDWLADKPHIVSPNNPIYQGLISRFAFLNDERLFAAPLQPIVPTCSSRLRLDFLLRQDYGGQDVGQAHLRLPISQTASSSTDTSGEGTNAQHKPGQQEQDTCSLQ